MREPNRVIVLLPRAGSAEENLSGGVCLKLCLQIIKLLTGRRGRSGDASVGGAGLGGSEAVPAPARLSPAQPGQGAALPEGPEAGTAQIQSQRGQQSFPRWGGSRWRKSLSNALNFLRTGGTSGTGTNRQRALEGAGSAARSARSAARQSARSGPGGKGRERGLARLWIASGGSAAGPGQAPTVKHGGSAAFQGPLERTPVRKRAVQQVR